MSQLAADVAALRARYADNPRVRVSVWNDGANHCGVTVDGVAVAFSEGVGQRAGSTVPEFPIGSPDVAFAAVDRALSA